MKGYPVMEKELGNVEVSSGVLRHIPHPCKESRCGPSQV